MPAVVCHSSAAVLKLALPRGRLESLQPVSVGSSSSLRVGQACFAIGNPFGLDHTLTQVRTLVTAINHWKVCPLAA